MALCQQLHAWRFSAPCTLSSSSTTGAVPLEIPWAMGQLRRLQAPQLRQAGVTVLGDRRGARGSHGRSRPPTSSTLPNELSPYLS